MAAERNQFEPLPVQKPPKGNVINIPVLIAICLVALFAMLIAYLLISHDKPGSNSVATVTVVLGFAGTLIATLFSMITTASRAEASSEKVSQGLGEVKHELTEVKNEVKETLDTAKANELIQKVVDATCRRAIDTQAQQIQNNTRAIGEQAGELAGIRADFKDFRKMFRLLLTDAPMSEETRKLLDENHE
jgi:uncharacterized membrane protein